MQEISNQALGVSIFGDFFFQIQGLETENYFELLHKLPGHTRGPGVTSTRIFLHFKMLCSHSIYLPRKHFKLTISVYLS